MNKEVLNVSLNGRKAKGFKFSNTLLGLFYYPQMDKYIDEVGVIEESNKYATKIRFTDGNAFYYPTYGIVKQITENLIENRKFFKKDTVSWNGVEFLIKQINETNLILTKDGAELKVPKGDVTLVKRWGFFPKGTWIKYIYDKSVFYSKLNSDVTNPKLKEVTDKDLIELLEKDYINKK